MIDDTSSPRTVWLEGQPFRHTGRVNAEGMWLYAHVHTGRLFSYIPVGDTEWLLTPAAPGDLGTPFADFMKRVSPTWSRGRWFALVERLVA